MLVCDKIKADFEERIKDYPKTAVRRRVLGRVKIPEDWNR